MLSEMDSEALNWLAKLDKTRPFDPVPQELYEKIEERIHESSRHDFSII